MAVELADGFESTIWNTIIPGACDYSMAIRQLTTAIAALSLADGLARTGELVRSDDGFRHRQYAVSPAFFRLRVQEWTRCHVLMAVRSETDFVL